MVVKQCVFYDVAILNNHLKEVTKMQKKSLLLTAVLAAATCAQAADVQVYGVIDTGFDYTHASYDTTLKGKWEQTPFAVNVSKSSSAFKLASGKRMGNRFGLKGSEKISDSITAGFVLEGGFDLDNGGLGEKDKLFNRQADLYVDTTAGEFTFGRVGTLASGIGTYGIFHKFSDNYNGGWGDHIGGAKHAFVSSGRVDNSVTYVSPEFAGVKLYGQYSFNQSGEQQNKVRENNRYAAVGATYEIGKLNLVGVFDKTFYDNAPINYTGLATPKKSKIADRWSLNLGGSYDFDVVKVFAAYQHADHAKDFGGYKGKTYVELFNASGMADVVKALPKRLNVKYDDAARFDGMINHANGFKTDTVMIGADVPLFNGVFKAQATYGKAKFHDAYSGSNIGNAGLKIKTMGVALGYDHPLSKRTQLYVGGAYDFTKYDSSTIFKGSKDVNTSRVKVKTFEAIAGLVHKF